MATKETMNFSESFINYIIKRNTRIIDQMYTDSAEKNTAFCGVKLNFLKDLKLDNR